MRKLTQKIESAIAAIFFFTGLTFLAIRLNQWRGRVPVLVYHSVSCPPTGRQRCVDRIGMNIRPRIFKSQIEAFSRRFEIVTLRDFLALRGKPRHTWCRTLVLSFDDGYGNNRDVVAPILEKAGARGTFFLLGPHISGERLSSLHAWYGHIDRLWKQGQHQEAERLFTTENRRTIIFGTPSEGIRLLEQEGITAMNSADLNTFMGSEDVRKLAARSHEVAGHGTGHHLLARLSEIELVADLGECRDCLFRILENETELGFAYPYGMSGTTGSREMSAVRDAGFTYAVTTEEGLLSPASNTYAIPRIQIDDVSPAVALFRAAGLRGWVKTPIQRWRWNRIINEKCSDRINGPTKDQLTRGAQ